MVTTAGEHWPEGWVKGRGFVRNLASETVGRVEAPRSVEEVGLEYVDQIVDCSAAQRSRYKGQLRTLMALEVTEDDVKAWLIGWQRIRGGRTSEPSDPEGSTSSVSQ